MGLGPEASEVYFDLEKSIDEHGVVSLAHQGEIVQADGRSVMNNDVLWLGGMAAEWFSLRRGSPRYIIDMASVAPARIGAVETWSWV